MAKRCTGCGAKIGLVSRKYWDVDEQGSRSLICRMCCGKLRARLDHSALRYGYTRLEIRPFPRLPLQIPLVCVACGSHLDSATEGAREDIRIRQHTSSATVQLHTVVHVCAHCAGLGLEPKQFVSIRYDNRSGIDNEPTDVIIELGNATVASLFQESIEAEMNRAHERLDRERKHGSASGRRDARHYLLSMVASECGIRSCRRVGPGDRDWVTR